MVDSKEHGWYTRGRSANPPDIRDRYVRKAPNGGVHVARRPHSEIP